MRLILIASILTLTGCYQRINATEVKQAAKFCSDKLGVLGITEYAIGGTVIHCTSGESIVASRVVLVK